MVSRDVTAALDRVASQPVVKNDIDYYNKHIGKITTVDEFMKDYRLYNYAVTAYGLDDVGYAKAFMKKVLESDLGDENSFANRMSDPRYLQFAAAFNFGAKGSKDVQSDGQEDELIGLYSQSYADEETSAETETDYYRANIVKVANVGALLGDTRLRNYMLQAVGLDPSNVSTSYLKSVLTSDLSDPASFANVVGEKDGGAPFKQLAQLFSFNADGTVANGVAQTPENRDSLIESYNVAVPSFTTAAAAGYNKAYYEAHIGSIRNVQQLTDDSRLFSYVKAAYGLDPKMAAWTFGAIIKSDPKDPKSLANVLGQAAVIKKFNFQQDGTVATGDFAQTDEQIKEASTSYMDNYSAAEESFVAAATKNYQTRMKTGIDNIDNFFVSNKADKSALNDSQPELWEMTLRAYGVDPATVSKTQLRKILTSDPYDPKSYVNTLKNDDLVKLVKDFNFDSKGDVDQPLQALPPVEISKYASDYKSKKTLLLTGPELKAERKKVTDDTDYFKENTAKVKTATDFLADKKLVSFIMTAEGLDPKDYSTDFLKKAFAADPNDAKGILNDPANAKIKDIVLSFNFDRKGNLVPDTTSPVQTDAGLDEINSSYLRQTLEQQEGQSNDGVRLALYFQRKASDVTSMYDIMGDKALFQVITTTFSLPAGISNMDVDQQAIMLKRFLNLKDLQDPKKVDTLVKRFAAMYDQQNKTTNSPALSVLSGGSAGISADTLLSIAQLTRR
jgi:hypothetical protein